MKKLETKNIKFYDGEFLGVRDEKGELWLGVKKACEDIGLTRRQMENERKRVQDDMVLSKGTQTMCLLTNGGQQDTICINEKFVNLWLAKIPMDERKKKNQPKTFEKLVKYQLECARILYNAFMETEEQKEEFFNDISIKGDIVDIKGNLSELK